MFVYLLLCRSLTYAQRTARELERIGITAKLVRPPKGMSRHGCTNAVKISQRNYDQAMEQLYKTDLRPVKVFMLKPDESYDEIRA